MESVLESRVTALECVGTIDCPNRILETYRSNESTTKTQIDTVCRGGRPSSASSPSRRRTLTRSRKWNSATQTSARRKFKELGRFGECVERTGPRGGPTKFERWVQLSLVLVRASPQNNGSIVLDRSPRPSRRRARTRETRGRRDVSTLEFNGNIPNRKQATPPKRWTPRSRDCRRVETTSPCRRAAPSAKAATPSRGVGSAFFLSLESGRSLCFFRGPARALTEPR